MSNCWKFIYFLFWIQHIRAQEENHENVSVLQAPVISYFSIILLSFLVFELVRPFYREAYACRDRNLDTRVALVGKRYGFLQWIKPVMMVPPEDLADYCGLDTVMFLRFQRLCMKLGACGITCSFVLFPVYATQGTSELRDPVDKLTMSNFDGSEANALNLGASVVAAYTLTFFALYLLIEEYKFYKTKRHEFLWRFEVQQYTVLIDNLPKNLRNTDSLIKYLNFLYPGRVRCAYVALELGTLEKDCIERQDVRMKLERLLTQASITGERPQTRNSQRCFCVGGNKVDSIDLYQDKLDQLNDKVCKSIKSIERRLQEASQSHENTMEAEMDISEKRDSTRELDELHSMRSSAFVTFSSIQAVHEIQQIVPLDDPHEFTVSPAPAVEDVYWSNIGVPQAIKRSGEFFSTLTSWAIIFFWTMPTLAVVSLSSISELQKLIPAIQGADPWVFTALEQVSPMMLLVMNAIVPFIFDFLSRKEGHPAEAQVQASTFMKLGFFQIIQTFFITSISGGIFDQMERIVNNPQMLAKILGEKLPGKSKFYMIYLTGQMGIFVALTLLRVIPIAVAWLHSKFAPHITPREVGRPWMGLKPLSCPGSFEQADILARQLMCLVLIVTYTPIAPLMSYFGFLYFLLSDIIFRRQVLFVHDPSVNSSGVFWPKLRVFIIVALLLSQVTLFGVVASRNRIVSIIVLALPICTLLFHRYISRLYTPLSKNLSLDESCRVDVQRSKLDPDYWNYLDGAYKQKVLKQNYTLRPEYTSIAHCSGGPSSPMDQS